MPVGLRWANIAAGLFSHRGPRGTKAGAPGIEGTLRDVGDRLLVLGYVRSFLIPKAAIFGIWV